MSSSKSGTLAGRTLIIIIIVAAIVGAGSGVAATYLAGERHPIVAPQARDFYLFTDALNFNETILGIPHDSFNPQQISVNLGDTVTIHYYNLEDQPEDHTFTMNTAPFWTQSSVTLSPGASWNNGNIILHQNQNVNITFVASDPGVFKYQCTLHTPTMTGYLIVVPP